ncbi:MAG TPA: hypothetical protein VGM39_19875, partial [Kofleriaceae bacterium]
MRLVLGLALVAVSGCSWFAAISAGYDPPCSKHYVAPIVDTTIAVASAVGCVVPLADLALHGD